MSAATSTALALRLARRELRGGLRGFGVFLACLFLGVFAISAIGSFTAAAESGLLADAGALLGGDIELRLAHRELPREALDFMTQRGRLSHVATLRSMAVSNDGVRTLIELKAVDAAYPLYGAVSATPASSTTLFSSTPPYGALVERSLLERLQLKVGDEITVGKAGLVITGVLEIEPDRSVRAFNLGPRVLTSFAALKASGLLQPGSLVYHAYRLRLPQREQAAGFVEAMKQAFPQAGWRLRTWQEAAPRVRFFLERMNLNLSLIGLCALLVGGLGVSGGVRGYLNGKRSHIATMKCLGGSERLIFAAYLLQILIIGALGALAALAAGAAVPYLVKLLIGAHLPVPLAPALYPATLLKAGSFGLLVALCFSLGALGRAAAVSPAILFRGYSGEEPAVPSWRVRLSITLAAAALAALAVLSSAETRLALWFCFGAAACFILLFGTSRLVITLVKRLPRPSNPALRLALGNIQRRNAPATSALFSLGLGLTALVVVMLVQANLDDRLASAADGRAPAYFFFDLQPNQVEEFDRIVARIAGVSRVERYPTLRGRITAIAGKPVAMAAVAREVRWAVRGDRFLSYSAEMPPGTRLAAGEWWPEDYTGEPLVSITSDLAQGFGVGVGDNLTVNILGREVTARIACLRDVDWSTLELNFALLFSPGVLEGAPQTYLAALHVPAEGETAAFNAITDAFPNVSALATRELLANVNRVLDRIGTAFRSVAGLALLTGFLVLAGALSADQRRRIHDAVIFKVCGATRADVIRAYLVEFLLLGLVAGLISTIVGSLAAMGISKGLMQMEFAAHPATVVATVATGVALALLLGLLGTWRVLGQRPAAYLRNE
jgi:putative ABC transport system permease protein